MSKQRFKHYTKERVGDFIPNIFRTVREKGGEDIVVGKLKPSKRKKGYSAWHVQAILHPLSKHSKHHNK